MIISKNRILLKALLTFGALLLSKQLHPQELRDQPPKVVLSAEMPLSPIDWAVDSLPRRTLFAIKTNLLYDVATAINIEVEVPIGERYSLCGEWIFPWWRSDSRQRCFELLNGTLEGRYWLGRRDNKAPLTGWAVGLYVGGGYYDLEWNGTGYQGEHLLSGGLSGSYAHSIGSNLRLEYSLGVGVLTTKYRKYEAEKCGNNWLLVRSERGRHTLFAPTRAKISLVWLLRHPDKRGGVR